MLTAEVKKRRESAEIYTGAGAADRAANETAEADFVEGYLPAALSDADLDALVSEAIASTGARLDEGHGRRDEGGAGRGGGPWSRRRQGAVRQGACGAGDWD